MDKTTSEGGSLTLRDQQIITVLRSLYPEPRSELNFSSPYELVVSVVLSAQCTDKKVNEVTPNLFAKYADFAALGKAKISDLERIIRPINYHKSKARHLQTLGELVMERHHGTLPRSHRELIELPGVGNKTANVVLSELGVIATFPVDTHVFRVARRLDLARGTTVEKVELALRRRFPEHLWRPLHHWLIFHGRRVCKAQRPACASCGLAELCPRRLVTRGTT